MKEAENRADFDHDFLPNFPDFPIRRALPQTLFYRSRVQSSRTVIAIVVAQRLSSYPTDRYDEGDWHIRMARTERVIIRAALDGPA